MGRRFLHVIAAACLAALLAAPAALAAPSDADSSFGTGGATTTTFSQGPSEAHRLALDPTGRIVAVGRRERHANPADPASPLVQDWVVARYLADGRPDDTANDPTRAFNGNGRRNRRMAV